VSVAVDPVVVGRPESALCLPHQEDGWEGEDEMEVWWWVVEEKVFAKAKASGTERNRHGQQEPKAEWQIGNDGSHS